MDGCIYRTKDNECDRYSEGGKYHAFCDDNCDMAVPSNADQIRSMTDEELAVQLALPYLTEPPWCAEHITCQYINEDIMPCDKCALEWLKQEAE